MPATVPAKDGPFPLLRECDCLALGLLIGRAHVGNRSRRGLAAENLFLRKQLILHRKMHTVTALRPGV